MTPLVVLGSYLLLFRGTGMGHGRRVLVVVITGLAVACHPSHLGLSGGLLIVGGIIRYAARFWPFLPQLRLRSALASLGLALALLLASNFALARSLFISRSGSVFVFARLMQDGIVQRLLDDTCPQSGYKLCAYKNRLKSRADAWLWAPDSSFRALGGFHSPQQQDEDNRIIFDSLKRYPVLQLRAAVYDSALQFLTFKTGDGIEPQVWVLGPGLHRLIPWQMRAYLEARQQKGLLRFRTLNLVHVPVGMLALLGLLLVLYKTGFSRRWDEAALPALVLLALMGNAIICGTFSNPHDRYQSRVIWLPVLVLLLARARDPHALQPSPESVT